jgi:hypothetical protein
VASRLERMPPKAPVSSRNGGISTSRAGKATNDWSRFSMVSPATTSTSPATSSTGSDSRTMRVNSGRPARTAPTTARIDSAAVTPASTGLTTRMPTR